MGDRPDIASLECHDGLSSARGCDELNFEAIGLIDLHDRAKIASAEAALGKVAVKYDRVELLELHIRSPGNAVTNLGLSSPCRTIHTETTLAVAPEGPAMEPCTRYFCP